MAVYLIVTEHSRRVKIGFTAGPIRLRLAKMQTDNPERLTVIRLLVGGEDIEGALHRRFAAQRLHGDWFGFCEEMLGDLGIEYIDQPLPDPLARRQTIRPTDGTHAAIMKQIGGRTFIAGALRVPVETVKSWHKRGIPARYWYRVVRLAGDKIPGLTIDALAASKSGKSRQAAA